MNMELGDAEDVKSLFKDELKWRKFNTKREFPLSSSQKEMCYSAPQTGGLSPDPVATKSG